MALCSPFSKILRQTALLRLSGRPGKKDEYQYFHCLKQYREQEVNHYKSANKKSDYSHK